MEGKKKMSILFKNPGKENTQAALEAAVAAAKEHQLAIVVATGSGETALKLREIADQKGYDGALIAVTLSAGASKVDVHELGEKLRAHGILPVTTTHALSAGERSVKEHCGGTYPLTLTADVLRFFGQGMKVTVEIATMAADTGAIPGGQPVVAVGGSSHGSDTVVILTPVYSSNLLETKVHEIIAKPGLYE